MHTEWTVAWRGEVRPVYEPQEIGLSPDHLRLLVQRIGRSQGVAVSRTHQIGGRSPGGLIAKIQAELVAKPSQFLLIDTGSEAGNELVGHNHQRFRCTEYRRHPLYLRQSSQFASRPGV